MEGVLRLYLVYLYGSAPFVHCQMGARITLGSGAGDVDCEEGCGRVMIASTLCKDSAIFNSVLRVSSSASSDTVVFKGGIVKIEMMSSTTRLRKSSVLTSGNGTTVEKRLPCLHLSQLWSKGNNN